VTRFERRLALIDGGESRRQPARAAPVRPMTVPAPRPTSWIISASASPPIWIGAAACSRSAPGSHALGADRRQIRLLAVLSRIAVPGPVVKPLGLALG
jgi:hypothetical protein